MAELIILGLSGRKQSGKSSISCLIQNRWRNVAPDRRPFVAPYGVADDFKRFCVDVLGLTEAQAFGSNEDKETLVPHLLWEKFPRPEAARGRTGPMKAREVLEEWALLILDVHPRSAIDGVLSKIKRSFNPAKMYPWLQDFRMIAIIDSVRFPHDVEAIQEQGGVVLRLTRDPFRSTSRCETALDPDVFDWGRFDKVHHNDDETPDETFEGLSDWLIEKGVL